MTLQPEIVGAVDNTHAPRPEAIDDSVMPDDAAGGSH